MDGLRAVAIRRWLGLLAIRVAISLPIPEEQPVTLGSVSEVSVFVMTGKIHLARLHRMVIGMAWC